jgi:hypothetical protein
MPHTTPTLIILFILSLVVHSKIQVQQFPCHWNGVYKVTEVLKFVCSKISQKETKYKFVAQAESKNSDQFSLFGFQHHDKGKHKILAVEVQKELDSNSTFRHHGDNHNEVYFELENQNYYFDVEVQVNISVSFEEKNLGIDYYYKGVFPQAHLDLMKLSKAVYKNDNVGNGYVRADILEYFTSYCIIYAKHSTKEIAVVFRGTDWSNLVDILINVPFVKIGAKVANYALKKYLSPFQFPIPSFHMTFYMKYLMIAKEISQILQLYPTYTIYFAGHGSGGSIATLAAFDVKKTLNINPIIVSFGASMSLDSSFVTEYKTVIPDTKNIRYTTGTAYGYITDPITHLPPFLGFEHVGQQRIVPCLETGLRLLHQCHSIDSYNAAIQRSHELHTFFNSPFQFTNVDSGMVLKRGQIFNFQWNGTLCTSSSCTVVLYIDQLPSDVEVMRITVSNAASDGIFQIPNNAPESNNYYICVNPSTFSCLRHSNSFRVERVSFSTFTMITPKSWYKTILGQIN